MTSSIGCGGISIPRLAIRCIASLPGPSTELRASEIVHRRAQTNCAGEASTSPSGELCCGGRAEAFVPLRATSQTRSEATIIPSGELCDEVGGLHARLREQLSRNYARASMSSAVRGSVTN